MTLRPYQEKAVQAAIEYFTGHKHFHALMVLPTGAGKSIVIAEIANRLGEPMLILVPSQEILKQNYDKYISTGNKASIYSASLKSKEVSRVTFATIGSIYKKPELFKHFKYFTLDECDVFNPQGGMYDSFFKQMEGRVLGLTATPYRLATTMMGSVLRFITRTRPRLFSEVIYWVQNKELVDAGYLTPLTYYDIAGFDRARLKLNSTGADFDERSLVEYMEASQFIPRLEKVVKRLLEIRRNMVVFTRFTREAQHLADKFPGQVAMVCADTPSEERTRLITAWREGKIKCLANVGILTVGVDFPELETIVMAKPTRSLRLYYQILGRGIRIHPNKKDCWAVDMCDNQSVFGKIEDLHLEKDFKGLWRVSSNGRALTNVNF